MDPAYISAIAALTGSAIGGLTSLATSLLTEGSQFRAQQRTHDITRRETLYGDFILESSKLYADAYTNNSTQPARKRPSGARVGRKIWRALRQLYTCVNLQPRLRPIVTEVPGADGEPEVTAELWIDAVDLLERGANTLADRRPRSFAVRCHAPAAPG